MLNQLCLFSYSISVLSYYELFESMMKQFKKHLKNQAELLSENDMNIFFRYYKYFNQADQQSIQTSTDAIKVFIRMISIIPIELVNTVEKYDSTQSIALMILKTLSETTLDFWATVLDEEWNSLRQGLVVLICIALFHNDSTQRSNHCSMFLCMITDRIKRSEIVNQLLETIQHVKCKPTREEMVQFYTLMGIENLTFERLELAIYLEIYINYLTKLIFSRNIHESWEDIVCQPMQKLLGNNALKSKLYRSSSSFDCDFF